MPSAVLCGLGAWLPPDVVTNADVAARTGTTDEWITARTGIRQRHVVRAGTGTADLAVEAGSRALKSAGLDAVDYVVLATTTPDRLCPATAPEVAHRLGLAGVPAFDVSAVCSGFLYATQVARALISGGQAETVLVVAAESFTTLVDPDDRATAPIFGDGAGAAVYRAGDPDEPGAVAAVALHSDGGLADLIAVDGGGALARSAGDTAPAHIRMFGRSTFAHAIKNMEAVTREVLAIAGWDLAEVKHVVGHQANARILTAVTQRLGLPDDAAVLHLDQVGNTAGASIPLALHHGSATGRIRAGDRLVLPAFGAGATWGAAALVWPDLVPG
ncbi:3-oxoacyl-[acyl-carrier-protein] synthase-3 [Actinokineospora baliensis]|uniref:beta-ketoacyl-ACP synthase 3 n=1 Tax=Actinokineospora baliensis TaxID=547056 RepID=UPI0027DDDC97|nr:beta-ketoacyl-ACP synthase 3 [Actinokineospora baliensis]MBM7773497.1 3-oxoacyl-[acyl-carrier-protein] synthase-3 [Actinokineospora baliensis]